VFSTAAKYPWLFSKRFKYLVSSYVGPEGDELNELYELEDAVHTASLFRGGVKWKGVSLVGAMGRSDLAKIHKWMNSQSRSPANYHASHEKGIGSTNLVDTGFNNLGLVSFDRSDMFAVSTISIVARLPKSCYITLLRLKNGVSYLSLYIYFDEAVEKKISNVDVRDIKRYKCFQSINPFSRRFAVIEHHDKRSLVEEVIYKNGRDVVSQARQAASAFLQVCGVKKSITEFSTAADFYREGLGSYFSIEGDGNGADEEEASAITVLEPWSSAFFNSPISDDSSENYIEDHFAKNIDVDAFFIKNEIHPDEGWRGSYLTSYNGVTDHYACMLMLSEIYADFKVCMKKVSPVFFRYKNSVRSDLKVLLKANLDLNLIEERLGAVESGLHFSDAKYWKYAKGRIASIRSQVNALRVDVERRKSLSDGELQLTNLIWMKRYSIIVFVLVLVQIALSVLNVDWTKEGRDKNPMYINLFSNKNL
jgi:hypothetical protein